MKKQKFWKKSLLWLIIFAFAFILIMVITKADREKELFEETKEQERGEVLEQEKAAREEYSFDLPFLLGRNVFEVKEIMENKHGEPVSFWEPTEAMFGPSPGAMSWLDEEKGIIFSFEYWQDGSINNDIFFLGGAKEQGHTLESVLQAGNLKQDSQDYEIEINPLGLEEMIDLWIIPAKKD